MTGLQLDFHDASTSTLPDMNVDQHGPGVSLNAVGSRHSRPLDEQLCQRRLQQVFRVVLTTCKQVGQAKKGTALPSNERLELRPQPLARGVPISGHTSVDATVPHAGWVARQTSSADGGPGTAMSHWVRASYPILLSTVRTSAR